MVYNEVISNFSWQTFWIAYFQLKVIGSLIFSFWFVFEERIYELSDSDQKVVYMIWMCESIRLVDQSIKDPKRLKIKIKTNHTKLWSVVLCLLTTN